MAKKLMAKTYTNSKGEVGCQISMPVAVAEALAQNDKVKVKELLDAVKAAVKAQASK